jgi:hypothetical protein
MCDERERLIGYLYDECAPGERREVERHLEGCDTCRQEIAGLQSVREDLLAWRVPEQESVWRPLVAPRVAPSLRDVPMWALAAAASVMFAVGAAGGVATHVWLSRTPAAAPAAVEARANAVMPDPAPTVALVPVSQTNGISPADLSALEQRVYARMRAEMDQRVRLVSTHTDARAGDDLAAEVRALRAWQQDQTNLNLQFTRDIGDAFQRTTDLGRRMVASQSAGLPPAR